MLGREPPPPRRGRSCRATCLDPWERGPHAPDLLPGEEGEGGELSVPDEDIPHRDLAGIWRVRRWAEVLGRTGERGLASG
jgi:hypothetical protein